MTKQDWVEFCIPIHLEQEVLNRRLDRIINTYREKIKDDSHSKDFIIYVSDLIRCEKFYEANREMDYLEDHLKEQLGDSNRN